jgi:hypothetical protein
VPPLNCGVRRRIIGIGMIRLLRGRASVLASAAIGAVLGAAGFLAVLYVFPAASFDSALSWPLAACIGLVTLQTFIYVRATHLATRLACAAAVCAVFGALALSYCALPLLGPVYSVQATILVPANTLQNENGEP